MKRLVALLCFCTAATAQGPADEGCDDTMCRVTRSHLEAMKKARDASEANAAATMEAWDIMRSRVHQLEMNCGGDA